VFWRFCLFDFGTSRFMRTHTGEVYITEPLEWLGGWIRVLVRCAGWSVRLGGRRVNIQFGYTKPVVY